ELEAADRGMAAQEGVHTARPTAVDPEVDGIAREVMRMTRPADARVVPAAAARGADRDRTEVVCNLAYDRSQSRIQAARVRDPLHAAAGEAPADLGLWLIAAAQARDPDALAALGACGLPRPLALPVRNAAAAA